MGEARVRSASGVLIMNQDQIQDALDFQAHEMGTDADAQSERAWLKWCRDVERLTGLESLDGDNSKAAKLAGTADGYSLDECYDLFCAGWSAERAARSIKAAL